MFQLYNLQSKWLKFGILLSSMNPIPPNDDTVQIETRGVDPIKLNIYKGDVVVSGMGGRFPESDDIEEFKKNLYDGVDMVTMDGKQWPAGKSHLGFHFYYKVSENSNQFFKETPSHVHSPSLGYFQLAI